MNESQVALLEAFGIPYDKDDVITPPSSPLIEGFGNDVYEYWGEYGPCTDETPFALNYSDEIFFSMNVKKIHRYSRKDRFRFTFYQLLGVSGDVPIELERIVKRLIGKRVSRSRVWNQVRGILKGLGLRRYYNRIPQIVGRISGLKPVIPQDAVVRCFEDFDRFHYQFDTYLRFKWKRSYFPNLRFVALKLMGKHGIVFPYVIPTVRTLRKKKYLNSLFEDFVC